MKHKIELYTLLNNCRTIENAIDILSSNGAIFCDEKIDDGISNDSVDSYLMLQVYTIVIDSIEYTVRLYYGDVSHKLGYFTITER